MSEIEKAGQEIGVRETRRLPDGVDSNTWMGTSGKSAIDPDHYRSHPANVECIQITEHMNFCLGNAVKYIWRAGLKGDAITDLRKAAWYIDREIKRLENGA